MMKKVCLLLLALAMCLALLPSFALAENEETAEDALTEAGTKASDTEEVTDVREKTGDRYLEINKDNFPDYYFRCWIIETLEVSGNDANGYYMTEEQATAITSIDFSKTGTTWRDGIQSLTGITLFPALRTLKLSNTKVNALDLHGCTTLESLVCEAGYIDPVYITNIDVSGCTALTTLNCSNNMTTSLNVTGCTALQSIKCAYHQLHSLDLSTCTALHSLILSGMYLYECRGPLTTVDLSKNTDLEYLDVGYNNFTSLDLSHNTKLMNLRCSRNYLEQLDLSANTTLCELDCRYNQLTSLDLHNNTELAVLKTDGNHLAEIDLDNNTKLGALDYLLGYQTIAAKVVYEDGVYLFNLRDYVHSNFHRVLVPSNANYTLNPETGIVIMEELPDKIEYQYLTAYDTNPGRLNVTVEIRFEVSGKVVWDDGMQYKGTTAYVIADGYAQTPGFTVRDETGNVIDEKYYTYEFKANKEPGTAYLFITYCNGYYGTTRGMFKIYLPATTTTTVENVSNGIKLTWSKVEGADGYVIYRRAWSSTTNGWTDFVRWNNTTALNWLDTKVYAGTRYQYGVKAYFNRRTDPVTGAQIGGNTGDNYNLGEVGPLKTTVRITTRTLSSVTAGSKQMTVKWSGSSVFTGYQIQYATNSAFTQNAKAIKITNPKTVQQMIKSLTSGKTYYVRVRSYHVFNNMTYFGEWSNVLSCKVK